MYITYITIPDLKITDVDWSYLNHHAFLKYRVEYLLFIQLHMTMSFVYVEACFLDRSDLNGQRGGHFERITNGVLVRSCFFIRIISFS